MKILNTIAEVKEFVKSKKSEGKSIGLVPTMGYLHEGHASLIKKSASENDTTIVSVFVNPTQFGPNEDLDKYPRDIENDMNVAENAGAEIIFHPTPSEMYGEGYSTYVSVENLTTELCGKSRPTHFRGVTTVVSKLFNITQADRAYFGQKDAQQLAVIKRMVKDLNFNLEIVACPIVREESGLAKSSRNVYLSDEEKKQALVLSRSLKEAEQMFDNGERNAEVIIKKIKEILKSSPLANIDYVEIVDFDTIQPIKEINCEALVALAVKFGNTRLIDNVILRG